MSKENSIRKFDEHLAMSIDELAGLGSHRLAALFDEVGGVIEQAEESKEASEQVNAGDFEDLAARIGTACLSLWKRDNRDFWAGFIHLESVAAGFASDGDLLERFDELETIAESVISVSPVESLVERCRDFLLWLFSSLAEGDGQCRKIDENLAEDILENGTPVQKYVLAQMFLFGAGCRKDGKRAAGILAELFADGNDFACYHLGVCALKGIGVARSEDTALRLFLQCEGNMRGQSLCNAGSVFALRGENEKAVQCWQVSFEAGEPAGAFNLACAMARGVGIAADPEKAGIIAAMFEEDEDLEFDTAEIFNTESDFVPYFCFDEMLDRC